MDNMALLMAGLASLKSDSQTNGDSIVALLSNKKGYSRKNSDVTVDIYPEDNMKIFLVDSDSTINCIFDIYYQNSSSENTHMIINDALQIYSGSIIIITYSSIQNVTISIIETWSSSHASINQRMYYWSPGSEKWEDNSKSTLPMYISNFSNYENDTLDYHILNTCAKSQFGFVYNESECHLIIRQYQSSGRGEVIDINGVDGLIVYTYNLLNNTIEFEYGIPYTLFINIEKDENGTYTCDSTFSQIKSFYNRTHGNIIADYFDNASVTYECQLTKIDNGSFNFIVWTSATSIKYITIKSDNSIEVADQTLPILYNKGTENTASSS